MCFSLTASFTASLVLITCGIGALMRAQERKIRMVAAVPLLFGIQQCAEGMVWLSFAYPAFASIRALSSYVFLLFALVIWPLWIPLAMIYFEGVRTYRRYIYSLIAGGMCALASIVYSLLYSMSVTINHHVIYNLNAYEHFGEWSMYVYATFSLFYVIATILPFFIARNRWLWLIGALIAMGYVVSYIFYYKAFTSVWCFFAALISLLVYWFVCRYDKIQ
jgi:hypothetical protein